MKRVRGALSIEKMKNVTLVVCKERLHRDFPVLVNEDASLPLCATYSVAPLKCKTKLGKWLAQTIESTKFSDPESQCHIALPSTVEGAKVTEFAERIGKHKSISSVEDAENLYLEIYQWIEWRRSEISSDFKTLFSRQIIQFKWPVYGSAASGYANSVEEYFDNCARQINRTGGVIYSVGGSCVVGKTLDCVSGIQLGIMEHVDGEFTKHALSSGIQPNLQG
jgi:hypothetical protein